MSIVVIGAGSMIAGALRRHPTASAWRYLSHSEALAGSTWIDNAGCVINLAFDSRLKMERYDPELDVDVRLARMLTDRPVRYIMASTRMAYGVPPADGRLAEDMVSTPINHYGCAKLAAERALVSAFGDRLTILRLSNIFDRSEAFGERRSFFGSALRSLITQGRIVFDMSPFVARDFVPADVVANWLADVAMTPVSGLFNLGAGFAVPTGKIAQWLIAGFGRGSLVISDFREHDGFWLDTSRAREVWGFSPLTESIIRGHCIAVAEQARRVS